MDTGCFSKRQGTHGLPHSVSLPMAPASVSWTPGRKWVPWFLGLFMLFRQKQLGKQGFPPVMHLPPIRLSSLSRYFLHICRPFSSSLGARRGRQLGQSEEHDRLKGPPFETLHIQPSPHTTALNAARSSSSPRHFSYLRKMLEVLRVGLRPHCYSVHLVVEPIQEEAKKLLSILLTEPEEEV